MKINKLNYVFLPFFLLFFTVLPVAAQSTSNQPTLPPAAISPTPEVGYDLPYPGILPNNPIYLFKVIRDNLIGFLISDPVKKAQFDLLQSDKRLQASLLLETNGNTDQKLVADTLSQSGDYFAGALTSIASANQQGTNVQVVASQLVLASKKHILVLQTMPAKGPAKAQIETEKKRFSGFEKQAESFVNTSVKTK